MSCQIMLLFELKDKILYIIIEVNKMINKNR
jgi:hypothetical protein